MSTYQPPIAHYRHFDVPAEWMGAMSRIIGKQGRHFIRITEQTRNQYIWFDKENARIEVWGPEHCIERGEHAVRNWAARVLG